MKDSSPVNTDDPSAQTSMASHDPPDTPIWVCVAVSMTTGPYWKNPQPSKKRPSGVSASRVAAFPTTMGFGALANDGGVVVRSTTNTVFPPGIKPPPI